MVGNLGGSQRDVGSTSSVHVADMVVYDTASTFRGTSDGTCTYMYLPCIEDDICDRAMKSEADELMVCCG